MGTFQIKCPSCNQKLEADEAWEGMEVECPKCSHLFSLHKPIPQLRISADKNPILDGTEQLMSETTTKDNLTKKKLKSRVKLSQNITLRLMSQILHFLQWFSPRLVQLFQMIILKLKHFWSLCRKKYFPILKEKYLIIQTECCRIWSSMSRRKRYTITACVVMFCCVCCVLAPGESKPHNKQFSLQKITQLSSRRAQQIATILLPNAGGPYSSRQLSSVANVIRQHLMEIQPPPDTLLNEKEIAKTISASTSGTFPNFMSKKEFLAQAAVTAVKMAIEGDIGARAYHVWAVKQKRLGLSTSQMTFQRLVQQKMNANNLALATAAADLAECTVSELWTRSLSDISDRESPDNSPDDGIIGYKAFRLGASQNEIIAQLKKENIRFESSVKSVDISELQVYGYYFRDSDLPSIAQFYKGRLAIVIFISKPYKSAEDALIEFAVTKNEWGLEVYPDSAMHKQDRKGRKVSYKVMRGEPLLGMQRGKFYNVITLVDLNLFNQM